MDGRHRSKMRRQLPARLLTVERPVAQEYRVCRVADIEDENVIAGPPAIGCVIAAPAYDVCDSSVAFPPALVGAGEGPGRTGLRSNNRVAPATVRTPTGRLGLVTSQISWAELA
jgi:hypothetical protein